MAVAESHMDQGFTFSKLWRDKRYRGVLMQILVIAGLFAFVTFIVHNAIENLAALGKTFGFAFLNTPASYDINQAFIEYDSRSSHFRAGLVGIINTGVVAVCGIVLATILGFLFGVLRLSNNWLVSRLVYCYVEFTRNVPVLVQILLWYGIIVNSLPTPKVAAADHGIWDVIFLSNRGLYIPAPVFGDGTWLAGIALVIAIAFAIFFKIWAKKTQDATGKIYPVFTINLAVIIGLPLLAFAAMGFPLTWEIPELKGFNFKGGAVLKPEFTALWLALSLYTAAFIAEIVRAGIQAVSHGQTEASYALGLKPSWTLRLVVIPQALRVIVPPLTSQYLNLTKNSSLAIAIGYMDIVATIGGITLNQTGKEMECVIIVMAIYLAFSLMISLFMNWYNKHIALVER